jgi:YD repeat-containing protein
VHSVTTKDNGDTSVPTLTQTFTYHGEGQVKRVTTTGSGTGNQSIQNARWIETKYTSDGYFATSSHNSKWGTTINASSQTVVKATGQVATATDANGHTVTNTYDGFYRLVKVSTPGVPDAVTAIQSCAVDGEAAGSCGTTHGLTEVYRKVTQQAGNPTSMVYLDAVGRALRSTTVGFDGTTVQSTSEYNRKGQMVSQTDPAGDVSFGVYDLLGRPASKTIDYAPQNYQVNYDYNGLTTGMTVTPLGSGSTRTISRTVNSAGKLMSSVDEASQSTKYRYNAAGLPSVIQGRRVNRKRGTQLYVPSEVEVMDD